MYPHYGSKEELLYAISLAGHRAALAHVRGADDASLPPVQRLRSVVGAFARWQAENNALARVVQYEIRSLEPAHYRAIVRLRRETTAILADVLAAGRESGHFDRAAPDGVLLAISSLCVDVCRWFPSGSLNDPVRVGELYADLAVRIAAGPEPAGAPKPRRRAVAARGTGHARSGQ
jgi:AcrR family transcriptional regulator